MEICDFKKLVVCSYIVFILNKFTTISFIIKYIYLWLFNDSSLMPMGLSKRFGKSALLVLY